MKDKIKFSTQIKPEFITELRILVNDYFDSNNISRFGNLNMVLKSIFMLSLYIVPFILMITGIIDSNLGILFSWITMGFGMAGVGMGLMHDANHGTYSKNKKTNSFLSKSLYLLGGLPVNWQYQHNTLHHGYTNIEGYDEDIDPLYLMRFSPHKQLLKIHRFQYLYAWFFYCLMTLSWSTNKDFKQLYQNKKNGAVLNSNKSYRQLLTDLVFSKLFYYSIFLILPLIVLTVPWYWIILSFLAMHFTSGLILAVIFQTAHVVSTSDYPLPDKNSKIDNNWAIHQLRTTSDYSPKSQIFSWLIGGLNYQVEHHLFPNICHVHYSKIASLVRITAQKHDVPYFVQDNFYLAIRSHIQMLKLLGIK
jgi:linoleoyl-CoA desaturase